MKNTRYLHEIAADAYDVPVENILDKTRKRETVQARQAYMMLLAKLGYGVSSIGAVTLKDHATAVHAKKTVDNLIDTDKNFAAMFFQAELEMDQILRYGVLLVPRIPGEKECYADVDEIEYVPFQTLKKNDYLINFPIVRTINSVEFMSMISDEGESASREIFALIRMRARKLKDIAEGMVVTMMPVTISERYFVLQVAIDPRALQDGVVGILQAFETTLDGFLDQKNQDKKEIQFTSVNI
jgi:hypothetical protein